MVLLHWPFGNTYSAYRVLEDFYKQGIIKSIGVSNYMPSQLVDLINFNEITPAVNQIEVNLLCQQKELTAINKKYNVISQAYAPFGQSKANHMFEFKEIVEIAKKYSKSPRQIALRFLLQNGIAVIPKSVHIERMQENINVFDFELTQDEMKELNKLDTGKNLIGCSQDVIVAQQAMMW
ncbi:MAG: aldo/keto reductase [Candidatus Gastranaerophilales bacterium]|nr:aldo/keto reductase [Candidatus Gastranaerophilales bacterium]